MIKLWKDVEYVLYIPGVCVRVCLNAHYDRTFYVQWWWKEYVSTHCLMYLVRIICVQLVVTCSHALDKLQVVSPTYLIPADKRIKTNHPYNIYIWYKNSYFPHWIPLWNSLPNDIMTSPTLVTFKKTLAN
jgi:hypothetical protein